MEDIAGVRNRGIRGFHGKRGKDRCHSSYCFDDALTKQDNPLLESSPRIPRFRTQRKYEIPKLSPIVTETLHTPFD